MNTKKNYLYNVTAEIVTTLIPLVTTPYVTRILDKDGMGAYGYVLTIAAWFALFAGFGVRAYGNRCIAQNRDDPAKRNRIFSGIFAEQLLVSAAVFLVYLLYTFLFGGEYRVLFLVFGINMVSAMLDITWLFYGMEEFRLVALSTVGAKIAVAAGIFLLVRTHDDLWIYALLCSLGVIVIPLFLWTRAFRYIRFVRVPFSEIRVHFLPCFALLIPMLAPTLYRSMDKLMLEGMVGSEAVGLYGAAEQLETCMLGFITALGTVMLPRVSHLLAVGDEKKAHDCIGDSMQVSLFLGSAFAFGIAAAARHFVPYYYGQSYADATGMTMLLSLCIFFQSWTEVIRSQYVIPHKRDRIFLTSVLAGALVNLLANAVLIPMLGAFGAIPGTVGAELAVPVVQYLFLRRELPYRKYLRTCLIFPVAGIIMFAAVYLTGEGLTRHGMTAALPMLCAEVAVGAAVYLLLIGGYYFLFRREKLKHLFSSEKG